MQWGLLGSPSRGLGHSDGGCRQGFQSVSDGRGCWWVACEVVHSRCCRGLNACERVTMRASLCLHTVSPDSPRLYCLVGDTPKATQ